MIIIFIEKFLDHKVETKVCCNSRFDQQHDFPQPKNKSENVN